MGAAGFFSQYRHTLDEKGRVSVPARFREVLDTDAEATGERKLYLTLGLDGCLFAYTPSRWQEVAAAVTEGGRHSFASRAKRDFQRMFFAQAIDCEPDSQGRILVPEHLRNAAELSRDVVFVGALDRMEIWDAARWDELQAAKRPEYEQAATKSFSWEEDA